MREEKERNRDREKKRTVSVQDERGKIVIITNKLVRYK